MYFSSRANSCHCFCNSRIRVKSITWAFSLFLLVFPGISGAQSFFQMNVENLKPTEVHAAKALLDRAEKLLPDSLKTQFSNGIEVSFSLKGHAHGKAFRNVQKPRMALNEKLIEVAAKGEQDSSPTLDEKGQLRLHKTMYQEALAAVLHETAHLYDQLNLQTPQTGQWISFCQSISADDKRMQSECAVYKNIKSTISTNPYYLEVAGWIMLSNGNGDRSNENLFRFRSPDPYELKNSAEHFAVNFEYFLLDPNFSCRRPGLANFLAKHFKTNLPICAVNYRYVDPDAADIDPKTRQIRNLFKEIPMDRVYQVHYLLAEPGSSMMSRFGHSMLRLVICAPGQPKGPACLTESLSYHLVLSFRAFINTPHINSVAGLTGKYPSRLFVVPFENVIQEYNEVEYRGLKSYPLKLSQVEIKNLVERSLETHWSYDSRYYFISNNCAVETLNLLKSSLMRPELINSRIIYPKDLLNVLLQENLASAIPGDAKKALEQGYYFDSSELKHIQSYNLFFKKNAGSKELQQFFKLPIESRKELYFQRFSQMEKPLQLKDLASPYQLERYLLSQKKAEFYSEVTSHIWQSKATKDLGALGEMNLNEIYQKAIEAFGSLSAPYQILKLTDYGIPSSREIMESEKEISKVRDRIQDAREVEQKVKKDLEKNQTYQETLKIRQLITEILDLDVG